VPHSLPIAEAVFINEEEAKAASQGHGKTHGFAVFVSSATNSGCITIAREVASSLKWKDLAAPQSQQRQNTTTFKIECSYGVIARHNKGVG